MTDDQKRALQETVRGELESKIWRKYREAHGEMMDEAELQAAVNAQFREVYEEEYAKQVEMWKVVGPELRAAFEKLSPEMKAVLMKETEQLRLSNPSELPASPQAIYPPPRSAWSLGTKLALGGIAVFLMCIAGLSAFFLISGPSLETHSPESWTAGFDDGFLVGKTAAAERRPRNPERAFQYADIHAESHDGDKDAYRSGYVSGYNEGWGKRDYFDQERGLPPGRQLKIRIFD